MATHIRFAVYLQVVLVATLAATTSLGYLRYFATREYLIATVAAAVVGAAVAALCSGRRWGLTVSLGLPVLGFALVGLFAVFRSTLRHGIPTWDTLSGFGSALVSGWARMLSVAAPADASGDLVLLPALLTFVAAAASTTLVIRTKAIVLPVLFPLLAYGAALVFAAPRPVGGFVLVTVVLALCFAVVLARAGMANKLEHAGARAIWGHLAFGLPAVLIAGSVGVAAGQLLPVASGEDRFQLREVVPVELDIEDHLSPLVTMKGQLQKPGTDLFTVQVDPAESVDRLRTATLEHFDGALWSSRDTYLLAGHALAPATEMRDPQRVSITVDIGELAGPYLPSIGAPVELDAKRAGYSAESGVVVTDDPSLASTTYRLTADVAGTVGLDRALPVTDAGSDRYIELPPGLPPELKAKGVELAGAVKRPFAKLTAIQDYLRSIPYSLDARPGHSYDALKRLVSANPADRVGYAEQFASAFAVLARSQGFPTRVAVGYLLRAEDRKVDEYTVKAGDAHAWAEVHFDGYGWVAFDPTDPERRAGKPPKDPNQGGTKPEEPDKPDTASQPGEDPNLPNLATSGASFLDWALWVLIALGVLAVLTPIAIAVEKYRRKRARRTGSRAAQIIGAWQQSTDQLVESGVPVTAAATTAEVALRAQEELGEPAAAVAVLAPLATSAMYSPKEPPDGAVAEAWQLQAQLGRELRRARNPLLVLRGWVDPRPLFTRTTDARRRRRDLDRMTRG